MPTKHSLEVKNGIKDKKIGELKAQLAVEPKSATGEANKLAVRLLVGLVVGLFVKYLYHLLPDLNVIQPDMQPVIDSLIVVGSIFVTTWIDKYTYQSAKNKGCTSTPVGIDGGMTKLAGVFSRKKTVLDSDKKNKK